MAGPDAMRAKPPALSRAVVVIRRMVVPIIMLSPNLSCLLRT